MYISVMNCCFDRTVSGNHNVIMNTVLLKKKSHAYKHILSYVCGHLYNRNCDNSKMSHYLDDWDN